MMRRLARFLNEEQWGKSRLADIIPGIVLEFRKAVVPDEVDELRRVDLEIFEKDAFEEELWYSVEAYWIVVDGLVAGCAAFVHDVDFEEDLREDDEHVPRRGTVY